MFRLYVKDILAGTSVLKYLKKIESYHGISEDQLAELQFIKLKKLLYFVNDNTDYYNRIFSERGITPDSITSLMDFKNLPTLSKNEVFSNYKELITKNYSGKIFKAKTGGTTGPPLVIMEDAECYSIQKALLFYWYNHLGFKVPPRILNLWGRPTLKNVNLATRLRKSLANFLSNVKAINSFQLGTEESFDKLYNTLFRFKPEIISGYLSSIIEFAKYIEKGKLKLPRCIRLITPTTETLHDHSKKYLEEVFNVPVLDFYGCTEISSVAFRCLNGNYHVKMEHCIVEIDEDSSEIIITNLDNFLFPLIRYKNGDLAEMDSSKCECGDNSVVLKRIIGRKSEFVVLKDGGKVHGVFFTTLLHDIDYAESCKISRFQVYQNSPGRISFKMELREELDIEFTQKLSESLGKYFSYSDIQIHEKLVVPENGKFRYIINEIKSE